MAQMGNSANKEGVEAPASTTATGNGDLAKPDSGGRSGGADQCESQRKEQSMCSPVGPRENNVLRSSRSTCFTGDMAVQWKACGGDPQGNPHGAWANCEGCALRLWYQPRKGSPSSHTVVNNAAMVQKALMLLQPMLRGALPTEEIVKAMLDKITAEETLSNKVQYLLEKPNVENSLKVPKSKAASKNVEKKMVVTMGYMDQSSPMTSPSDSSWDPILDSQIVATWRTS